MSQYEWTCAGCGAVSPNKIRSCDCPTNVVSWDRKQAWKRDIGDLECPGAGRDAANDKSICFYFNRRVTDDELRYLHEVMQRAVKVGRARAE